MSPTYNIIHRALILVAIVQITVFIPVISLAPQVSLVTWNLLAPNYAKPSKYPWSKEEDLQWKVREPRIIKELTSINADVVCLQEVQVDLWEGLLSKLAEHGYHGVLQEMGRRHPVANAILVRQGLSIVRTESRSRALIAVVRDEEESSSPLYIANVHLDAGCGEENDVTRFNQVRSLCKRLKNQISKDIHSESSSDSPTVVITGDCNMLRESPLYELMKEGVTRDPQGNEISAPLLPLHDAYLNHPPPWGPDVRMSYRSGHLLDYVWVSDAVDVLRTMPVTDDVATVEPKAWPSANHPSDHIPIGAILSWTGAPSRLSRERSGWQQVEEEYDYWTIPTTGKAQERNDCENHGSVS